MTVFEKIEKLLSQNKIEYQIFEHAPVYTSLQAAQIRNEDPSIGAKSIVAKADGQPVLVVVPGDKKIDIKKFKRIFTVKDLRLATADEVFKICGIEIGAIPPFGNVINLPIYLDKTLAAKPEIVFNAGLHTVSIKMKTADFVLLVKPTIADFSKESQGEN